LVVARRAGASAHAPDDERRLELELDHGISLKFSGDAGGGEAALDRVATTARNRRDRRIELRAEVEMIWMRWSRRALTLQQAMRLFDEAIPVFEAEGDDLSAARAFHVKAAVSELFESGSGYEQLGLRAREHYRRAGLGSELTATMLAVTAEKGSLPVPKAIQRCHELLAEVAGPAYRSFVLPPLACLEAMAGHFDDARAYLEEARRERSEFSDPTTIASSWAHSAAWVELLAGAPETAEVILTEACQALRNTGDDAWLATNLAALAEALYRQGHYAESLSVTKEALTVAPADDRVAQSLARSARAKALARTRKFAEAERFARQAVAMRESSDLVNEHAEALLALAEVLGLRGKTTEAAEALERARALFEGKGNVVAADRTRASLLALAG
jgi:tetratricopeptide (TPR) repeat protein